MITPVIISTVTPVPHPSWEPVHRLENDWLTDLVLRSFVGSFIDFPKPLIAAINGPAVGISVTILGLFDIVYATDRATFHTPFMELGQSPEGCSSFMFPRIMGPSLVSVVTSNPYFLSLQSILNQVNSWREEYFFVWMLRLSYRGLYFEYANVYPGIIYYTIKTLLDIKCHFIDICYIRSLYKWF